MYDLKILVPVSLSPSSDHALEQAICIAKEREAMITCLHVIEMPGFLSGLKHLSPEDQLTKRRIEIEFSSRVHKIFEQHRMVPFELILTGGKVHKRVVEKVRELQADLVVMGRSDEDRANHPCVGSNALKVISACDVPVFSVRKNGSFSPRHMLIPLWPGTRISQPVSTAVELSAYLGMKVTLAQITGPGNGKRDSSSGMRLEMIRKVFHTAGVICDTMIIPHQGSLWEELWTAIRDRDTDLVFLVNHDETDISHSHIESDIHNILRNSEYPVLSINPRVLDAQPFQKKLYQKTRRSGGSVSSIDNCVLS